MKEKNGGPDWVQKGSRRGLDWVQMGSKRESSRGSRLRGPRFVPTLVKIETSADNRSEIYLVKKLSKSTIL